MKKIALLILSLLLMVAMVAGCGKSGPKKMVIGLDDNFAPMVDGLVAVIALWGNRNG